MKVVVLGAGLMGKEVARDLIKNNSVERVFLGDIDVNVAQQFVDTLNTDKVEVVELHAENDESLTSVIAKGNVVVNALFYSFNERVARAAIEAGVHSVDLGGHIGGVTEKILALHEEAKAKGVTIIPDLGVAPGMVNILAGYGATKLDEVESIKLYVGGIPTEPKPPLHYTRVFSLDGVFDHYTQPSKMIQKGKLEEVPSLSGIEPIYFDGFGVLEAFYTSGGISTLYKTFPNVHTLEYKTIRYKGHAEKFKLLADLGFLDASNNVELENQEVPVRAVVREALKKKLELGTKPDAVLLRVIVAGEKAQQQVTYEYEMVVRKDMTVNETAMARATANTISVVAQMIGDGLITERGVFAPETIVPGEPYIKEMAKRGVVIKETSHKSAMIVKW
ncbi:MULTISPECIES: saccharopine dehydrogenase family protein [unclassified Lysinibacillus]|uniref:saccharopine dehydrogenase family protein n=1 Tax=unclassified Lysinibacillus TaxID=2636778 RepID=UPI00116DE781|nr:saccharopine dehydrogenase C-terminal domain-containing protein [Lysinibacillus sp. CD3-6]QPQ37657.1 saccharopine dehydrogenase NADP-binding domain-containing protein [Lysinibacillus sp. JNUCC-52]UED82529.1 saccharopine dehydrogenase NADP-binding domain-containing protein [Lysinibacillus sp. CD3-6]